MKYLIVALIFCLSSITKDFDSEINAGNYDLPNSKDACNIYTNSPGRTVAIKDNESTKKNRPSLYDTKKWILQKFRSYGNPDFTYNIIGYNLIIKTSTNPSTAIEYTIPLCSSSIYINRYRSSYSETITFNVKEDRIKIDRNWKGFPHFKSRFDFDFRYSSENNLIKRINDALDNLKYYCPEDNSKKETF